MTVLINLATTSAERHVRRENPVPIQFYADIAHHCDATCVFIEKQNADQQDWDPLAR